METTSIYSNSRPALPLLTLSDADIVGLQIPIADVVASVRSAFIAKAERRASTGLPLHFVVDTSLDFKAKGGALLEEGLAAVKWYGFAGGNAEVELPYFIPVIVLNEFPTGKPVALLDGHWISAVRTAAISANAASVLAKQDARSVGFIAAGMQARSHLDALRSQFPLRSVKVYSRSGVSARQFAEHARSLGLDAEAVDDPHRAIENQDIVVSSVPRMSNHVHFLDARRLAPGTFVAMVDGGRSWAPDGLAAFKTISTDDFEEGTRRCADQLSLDVPLAADLAELLTGRHAPTANEASRAIVFGGSGLADIAVAALVYRRAQQKQAGRLIDL